MTTTTREEEQQTFNDLNLQTAQISWQEIERFFAAGQLIYVDNELDLVHVAVNIVHDNKSRIEALMEQEKIHPVTDQQASSWQAENTALWAVVVKPWVLVQVK